MIAYLRGTLQKKALDHILVDVGGVGYEVFVPLSTLERVKEVGQELKIHIVESASMYGGTTKLYGFLTEEELEIFQCMKDHLPNTGAKKALEYLDKAAKSLPDFRRAVLEQDTRILASIFGFTAKTAEKLSAGLKDRLAAISLTGPEKWSQPSLPSGAFGQAIGALVALGYKESEAREAVASVEKEFSKDDKVEEILARVLRQMAR